MFASTYFSDLTLDGPEFTDKLKTALRALLETTEPKRIIVMTGHGSNGKSLLVRAIQQLMEPRCCQPPADFRPDEIPSLIQRYHLTPTSISILHEVEDGPTISRHRLNLLQQLPGHCVVVGNSFDATLNRLPNLLHLDFPATFVQVPTRANERHQNPDLFHIMTQHPNLQQELLNWIYA